MQHIEYNLRAIKRRIMVRVWYSYILSLFENRFAWVGILFGASVTLFTQLVSLADIFRNLLEVKLGLVPQYIWNVLVNAVSTGELLKVVSLLLILLSTLYLLALLKQSHWSGTGRFIQSA
ncbi:MAG TPA: hypothetical protein PKA42_01375 [Candidatus Paceibacterota bacterium]|nr:hypothetical protein [Candidatus Paceibacterota bacterium]HMO82794.1 hypothetical protein [Candidatus Paceibacterota bacterium]